MVKKLLFLCVLTTMTLHLSTIGTVFSAAYRSDFETYTVGALNGQGGWVTSANVTKAYTSVVQDITDPTNKVMVMQDNDGAVGTNATLNFGTLSGATADGIVTVQYRFNPFNQQSYQSVIQLRSGSTVVVDFYNDYKATVQNTSSTQVWLLNHPLPGGTPGVSKALQGVLYGTGRGIWYNMKFVLNFNTKTVDVYTAPYPKIPTTPVLSNVPFANDAVSIDRLYLYSPSYSTNCEIYLDDIYITDGYIADFDVQAGSATYSDAGSSVTTNASLTMPIVGDGNAMVFAAAYDDSGRLIGAKSSQMYTKSDLVGGVIPYTSTFSVTGTVSTVKLYVWESFANRIPYCEPAVCTKIN